MLTCRSLFFLLVCLAAGLGSCSKKTVSFNSRPESGLTAGTISRDSLTTARDTTNAPSLVAKQVVMTKEQERAAKEKEKESQRKVKKKKNVFLGERIKKGITKSGPKGRNQVIEIFYYLKFFKQPSTYATTVYYFSPKKRKIFSARTELNPATDKVMHGPYKKLVGGKVVETGYYAFGTKHLRWEKFTNTNILVSKLHYEMGFPRDANVSYYDADRKLVKEVIPFVDGKTEGDYVRYLENGQRDWEGQFENGKKIGVWTKYWGFRTRNHRRYEFQYGESGSDPEVTEPVLIREYNRNGGLIYDKEKGIDKRDVTAERPGSK
ncbi:hypothetical protein LJY25_06170 [Hymenobacter sp. BT175]|uniref:toxin-antitoxin system YwqK family antitoxin n=1 Tax=Hymenobacter translucens TaxID=2886507 RepID=UPI001D0E8065|nr:hypothetical protein [Hymenobacter translucens]MCC2546023.1 hypothetical protein [Hymenobacter translucens]